MKTQIQTLVFAAAISLLAALPLRAQLVADGGTKIIDGISTNITGSLTVGNNGSFTTLIVTNGGAVTNSASGFIGNATTSKTNQVIVTGANSVWANGTTLAIGSAG